MARSTPGEEQPRLQSTDIHEILKNKRRRMVLELLCEAENGTVSVRELTERIADEETNESPAPRAKRQSVYVSLHQSHLPKLDGYDIIDYDMQAKIVHLRDTATQVLSYVDRPPKYGLTWGEFYVVTALCGLTLILAAELDVPIVSTIESATWAIIVFLLVGISASYQKFGPM